MAVATRPPDKALDAQPRPDATRRRRGGLPTERKQAVAGYLFVLPAMMVFFVFTLLPVTYAFYLSFTNYDIFTKQDWIGTVNYEDVFQDELFRQALGNTVTYTVWTIP